MGNAGIPVYGTGLPFGESPVNRIIGIGPGFTVIGIDPGFYGAIAFFKEGRLNYILDMPIIKESGKTNLNIPAIQVSFQESHVPDVIAYVENVHAMPGQGVTSMFRFGYQIGALHALIVGMGWNLKTVSPQSWKKEFGLIGRPKEAALEQAIKLFPSQTSFFSCKKDTGRADAALIGYYGILRQNRDA